MLAEILRQDGYAVRGVYERNDAALRDKEGLPQYKAWLPLPGQEPPASPSVEIVENGIKYLVDVENGQKTGFFLDQKYNRRAGLLHPHRLLCPECRRWRSKTRHCRGYIRVRPGNGSIQRGAKWSGEPDGLSRRRCI